MTKEQKKVRADAVLENYIKSVECIDRVINNIKTFSMNYLNMEKEFNDTHIDNHVVDIKHINSDKLLMEKAAAALVVQYLISKYGMEGK